MLDSWTANIADYSPLSCNIYIFMYLNTYICRIFTHTYHIISVYTHTHIHGKQTSLSATSGSRLRRWPIACKRGRAKVAETSSSKARQDSCLDLRSRIEPVPLPSGSVPRTLQILWQWIRSHLSQSKPYILSSLRLLCGQQTILT